MGVEGAIIIIQNMPCKDKRHCQTLLLPLQGVVSAEQFTQGVALG